MIYLNNTTEAQEVYIPRDTEFTGALTMSLRSTVDLDTVLDATVLDLGVLRLYLSVAVQLPEGSPTGEYQYELKAGDNVVSTGLCIVLPDDGTPAQYENPITYEQYER